MLQYPWRGSAFPTKDTKLRYGNNLPATCHLPHSLFLRAKLVLAGLFKAVQQLGNLCKLNLQPPSPNEPPKQDLEQTTAQALESLATRLRQDGIVQWMTHPHQIVDAIVKIEQSWALRPDADIAIQLGVMYDLVNRHDDTLAIYRQAFHRFPEHARLRHEAGITLLRHGAPHDIQDFFESVQHFDSSDVFAQFVSQLLGQYPSWIDSLEAAIGEGSNGRSVYLLTCPVWGEPFTTNFIRYLCATLLAPNNLPALVEHHDVHFAVFTTHESELRLKADPVFEKLAAQVSIHFIRYDSHWVQYKDTMDAHYGPELGPYYSRTCKFLLFSGAHYSALAAGRRLDCQVMPLCADMVLNDGALTETANMMAKNIDVVAIHGIRISAHLARPIIEQCFRGIDGSIAIPPREFARLLIDFTADAYFVDSRNFSSFPEFLCWHAGQNAMIIHGTHYTPICVRPNALAPPFELTIDPVDSRFLNRRLFDKNRIVFVRDVSIACLSLEEVSGFENKPENQKVMTPDGIGTWLWQVWSPWRAMQFASPLCVTDGALPPEWEAVRVRASATAAAIIRVAEDLEEGNRCRKSWKLRPPLEPRALNRKHIQRL